jgi:hypothetical protein
MKPELENKLVDLQAHLLEKNDNKGLFLWDAVRQAIKQDDSWEEILVWAASCQAATAEGYAYRKSASKGERTRHATICKKLVAMLATGVFMEHRGYQPFPSVKQATLKRLQEAVDACIKANV